MTPQEQATIEKLDRDLPLTKTIDNLKKGQEEIRKDIQDEREFNKSEFTKGAEKFKAIFTELKEAKLERKQLKEEVSEMKEDYKKGVKEIVDTINNKEISDLRGEIRDNKQKQKEVKMFWSGVAKSVLSGIVIAIVLYGLSKIGVVAP